jgi:hypothetical protein
MLNAKFQLNKVGFSKISSKICKLCIFGVCIAEHLKIENPVSLFLPRSVRTYNNFVGNHLLAYYVISNISIFCKLEQFLC